jgi:hypothetical protein
VKREGVVRRVNAEQKDANIPKDERKRRLEIYIAPCIERAVGSFEGMAG